MSVAHSRHATAAARIPAADTPRLVLASASPRRHELLAMLGATFIVEPTDAEESNDPVPPGIVSRLPACPLRLTQHPTLLAWRKAYAIWVEQGHTGNTVVLAADTVVVLDGHVIGKPRDAAHARAMLAQLSGKRHTVYTGLCVYSAPLDANTSHAPSAQTGQIQLDLVSSDVTIAPLRADDIARYVDTGEPLDKAGAYGIQGLGGQLVRQVVGSYTAVVGLPLPATWSMLHSAGISDLQDPTIAYQNWLHCQGKEPLPCPPTLP